MTEVTGLSDIRIQQEKAQGKKQTSDLPLNTKIKKNKIPESQRVFHIPKVGEHKGSMERFWGLMQSGSYELLILTSQRSLPEEELMGRVSKLSKTGKLVMKEKEGQ